MIEARAVVLRSGRAIGQVSLLSRTATRLMRRTLVIVHLVVLIRGTAAHAEHDAYVQRVVDSRMAAPRGLHQTDKVCAPVISSTDPWVDHLLFESTDDGFSDELQDGTPAASFLQATWPIATDELLKYAVTDVTRAADDDSDETVHGYTPFRLSRWFQALDALTADVAYRHTHGVARDLVMVTASHYNSIKLRRTAKGRDLTIRCYVTAVSSSSLEVRTDALQIDDQGNECLLNVCYTGMPQPRDSNPRQPTHAW